MVDSGFFLEECRRVLKRGGSLVITTPNLASLENRLRLLLGIYPAWMDYANSGAGHVRNYTLPVLKKQLRERGFEPMEAHGNFIPLLPQRIIDDVKFPPLGMTGDLAPSLAQGIIVRAEKR